MMFIKAFIRNLRTNLRTVLDAYDHIAQPRRRFKIFFNWSVIIIILAIIGQELSEQSPSFGWKIANIVSKIVIAVFTSVAAAALIEIFSGIRDVWIREQTQKEFRDFFGCEYEEDSVEIVIPRFPMKELQRANPEVFGIDLDTSGAIKRLSEVSDMVLAYADVKTASEILIAFTQVDLVDWAKMVWDDDTQNDWKAGKTRSVKTIIVVGLYSNRFFWEVYQTLGYKKFFKINATPDGSFEFNIAKHEGDAIGWHPPRRAEQNCDYVLLTKVKLNSTQKAFIVGGITAQGTERIGQYLRDNWRKIYEASDSSSGTKLAVKGNEFAMAISVPLPDGNPSLGECYVDNS
jgi:hypothetical protein